MNFYRQKIMNKEEVQGLRYMQKNTIQLNNRSMPLEMKGLFGWMLYATLIDNEFMEFWLTRKY